jgi:hypothetical protein
MLVSRSRNASHTDVDSRRTSYSHQVHDQFELHGTQERVHVRKGNPAVERIVRHRRQRGGHIEQKRWVGAVGARERGVSVAAAQAKGVQEWNDPDVRGRPQLIMIMSGRVRRKVGALCLVEIVSRDGRAVTERRTR